MLTVMSRPEATDERVSDRWLDIVTTVLLTLATVATAWAAYQSREWTGEQSQGYSRATASRIAVNRTTAVANRQEQIDVATFIQWIDANARGDDALARFYRARFRGEFKPAFAAWLATNPFSNTASPQSPFEMPQYRLAASAKAEQLEARAGDDANRAKDANERANAYMLAVVLFSSVLFFAGISIKLRTRSTRVALLTLGCVVFLGTVVWLGTLPIRVTA
jgi:hypothetical protein